jgi:hypothetical protein
LRIHDYRCPRPDISLLAPKNIPSPTNWAVNKRPLPEKPARLNYSSMRHYQHQHLDRSQMRVIRIGTFSLLFHFAGPAYFCLCMHREWMAFMCQQVPITLSFMPMYGQLQSGLLQTSHIFKETLGNSQHIPHVRLCCGQRTTIQDIHGQQRTR